MSEIDLTDLLDDAARVLRDAGLNSLARAVQLCAAELTGEPPEGEAFIRDILGALDACDNLAAERITSAEDLKALRFTLDGAYVVEANRIERLATEMSHVHSWGLRHELRLRNGFALIVSALADVMTAIDKGDPATARDVANQTLERLGFERADDGTQTKAGG